MIFYDCATAPSPRRSRIFLAEKQVPHEVVNIDLAKAEQMSDDFRKINPACTVPALKLDDGVVLTDNAGIAAYLEAQYPEPQLLGRNALEKAKIATWNTSVEMNGLMAIAEALRNSTPRMKNRALPGPVDYAQIPALAERGLERLHRFFKVLDKRLVERDYIATDNFTVADITALVAVDFARVVKVKPMEQYEQIRRWREALDSRPSVQL